MALINATALGAPLDIAVGATVNVAASPTGATSYFWEFLDKPEGSVAAFVNPHAQSTSFVIDTEGSYFIRLTVNGTDVAQAIVAAPFLTTEGSIRVPAVGEVLEADPVKGWGRAVQAALRLAVTALNVAQASSIVRTWKDPCRAASTGDVPLTGPNPLILDTISIPGGSRVLLRAQADPTENGIYECNVTGLTYTLTRSADANTGIELEGAVVLVQQGFTFADLAFVQLVEGPITIGVTPLFWSQLASASATVVVPGGTSAQLTFDGPKAVLRWTVSGTDYEVELTANP